MSKKQEARSKKQDVSEEVVIEDEVVEEKEPDKDDRYLRLAAEFDNFRKRTAREKALMYDDGVVAAVSRFLPVFDSFERALSLPGKDFGKKGSGKKDSSKDDNVVKGFGMILRQMKDVLAALGVEEINAVGKPFDPMLHEAVMTEAAGENEPGTVIQEVLPGYTYKGRPIRHSMVKVAE